MTRVVADINENVLKFSSDNSDRFVHSLHFIERRLVPFRITKYEDAIIRGVRGSVFLQIQHSLEAIDIYIQNGGKIPKTTPLNTRVIIEDMVNAGVRMEELDNLKSKIEDLKRALFPNPKKLDILPDLSKMETFLETFLRTDDMITYFPISYYSFLPILWQLKSSLGYVFLDRTRIRPAGFGLGEHVFSLSLAPGEEVSLEQKNWTKRQVSLEDLMEKEQELDIELSSMYSTEFEDGLKKEYEIQLAANASYSPTMGMKFGISDVPIPIEGIPVPIPISAGIDASYSGTFAGDLREAHNLTSTQSMKRSFQRTSKVASKYRALHKTTFKISKEEGFESSSKRVIRNPNMGTPINLHYFKVTQIFDVQYERHGIRLCWAPFVKDPGLRVRDRIKELAESIPAAADTGIVLPTEPQPPSPSAGDLKTKWVNGPSITLPAPSLGWVNPLGGYSEDFEAVVTIPTGGEWDRVHCDVELHKPSEWKRFGRARIEGAPWVEGTTVKAKVHVEISNMDCKPKVFGGHGHNPIDELSNKEDAFVQLKILVTEVTTQDQTEAMQRYAREHAEWEEKCAQLRKDAREAAYGKAFSVTEQVISHLNPLSELLARIVEIHFPHGLRDEGREVDWVHNVFDFESSGFMLYPGWWENSELNYPERSDTDFLNASWARVFLPIQVGREIEALSLIYNGSRLLNMYEDWATSLRNELNNYRKETFGSEKEELIHTGEMFEEKYKTLGRWKESLPTDGTHVEVVIGATTGFDMKTEEQFNNSVKISQEPE